MPQDPLEQFWNDKDPLQAFWDSPPEPPQTNPPGIGYSPAIAAKQSGLGIGDFASTFLERLKKVPDQISDFAAGTFIPQDPKQGMEQHLTDPATSAAATSGLEAVSTLTGPLSVAAGEVATQATGSPWLGLATELAASVPEGAVFAKLLKLLGRTGRASGTVASAVPSPASAVSPAPTVGEKVMNLTVEQQANIARDPALKQRLMDTAEAMFDAGGKPEEIMEAQKRLIDEIMPPRPEKVVGTGFDPSKRAAFLAKALETGQFTPRQASALFRDPRFARNIMKHLEKNGATPDELRQIFGDLVDGIEAPAKIGVFADEAQKSLEHIAAVKGTPVTLKAGAPEGTVIAASAPASPAARDRFAALVDAFAFGGEDGLLAKIREFRALSAVSGLSTHFLNVSSEGFNMLGRVIGTEAAALADLPLAGVRKLTGRGGRERYFTEGLSELVGLFRGLDEAMFTLSNKSREAAREYLRQPVKTWGAIFKTKGAIGGKAGEVLRTPFGFLGYMDTFLYNQEFQAQMFKSITRQGLKEGVPLKDIPKYTTGKLDIIHDKLNQLEWYVNAGKQSGDTKLTNESNKLIKELFDDPLIAESKQQAAQATFQEPLVTKLDKFVLKASQVPGVADIALFIQTPYRVGKEFVRQTPAALGKLSLKKPLDPKNADALGKGALGSALMALGAYGHQSGTIQAEIPGFSPEAATMRAAEMATAGSIRIGDRTLPLENLGPTGLVIGAGALAAKMVEGAKEKGLDPDTVTKLQALVESVMYTMITQTPAQNIAEAFNAIMHPEITVDDAWSRTARQIGRSFVPNIIQRTARAFGEPPEAAHLAPGPAPVAGALSAVPGLDAAPTQTNVFGQPIEQKNRGVLDQIGNYLISRGLGKTEAEDPVLREMIRLSVWKSKPSKRISILGETRKLTPEEEWELQNARGLAQHEILRKVLATPAYQSLNDQEREKVLRRFIRRGSNIGTEPFREEYKFRETVR